MKTRQVEDVVRSCEQYWKRTGVPRGAIREMRLELEGHLHDAVADGRSLESVVGDEKAFAETWAREFRAPMVILDRRARVFPALAGLAAGLFNGLMTLTIAVGSSAVSCCPRRVVESQTDSGGVLLFWITLVVAILALAGAVSMILGRARLAALLWGIAVVPSFISAGTWLITILLLLAIVGARKFYRQGARQSALSLE